MKTALVACLLLAVPFEVHAAGLSFTDAHVAGVRGPFPFNETELPQYGDATIFYGKVSAIGPPFSSIAPVGNNELTFYIDATCSGMGNWDDFECQTGGLLAGYNSATLSVYSDPSNNSVDIAPETYRDGELVLRANETFFFTLLHSEPTLGCPTDGTDIFGFFDWTGGSWFQAVSGSGANLECYVEGELTGTQNLPLVGTVLNFDGSILASLAVAVEPTTWGRVKALYR